MQPKLGITNFGIMSMESFTSGGFLARCTMKDCRAATETDK